MTRAPLVSALVACAAAVGACGDDERPAAVKVLPTTPREARAPASPAGTGASPARLAPTASAPTAATGATGAAPGANPGGASADGAGAGDTDGRAGDASGGMVTEEEAMRQSARFTVGVGDVRPASVTVAPFIAVTVAVVNADQAVHRVKLVGTDVAFDVAPGTTEERSLPGLKAGMYTVSVDGGKAAASLVVGDEAAP